MKYGPGWFASVFKLFGAFSAPVGIAAPDPKDESRANGELAEPATSTPCAADAIVLEPVVLSLANTAPAPTEEDRRELMRRLFNDYWSGVDDKPTTFAERLDAAEDYINNRLAERNAGWLLDAVTRKKLGLPQSRARH
jgi:hypothetical protein